MIQILTFLLSLTAGFAHAAPISHTINRRDFVSLNRDTPEILLTIPYPGTNITQVCGIQLRTNIPHFANEHLKDVIAGLEVTELNGSVGAPLSAVQDIAEPPFFLVSQGTYQAMVSLKTKTGENLRALIQRVADPKTTRVIDVPVEVIAIAKHCGDQSGLALAKSEKTGVTVCESAKDSLPARLEYRSYKAGQEEALVMELDGKNVMRDPLSVFNHMGEIRFRGLNGVEFFKYEASDAFYVTVPTFGEQRIRTAYGRCRAI